MRLLENHFSALNEMTMDHPEIKNKGLAGNWKMGGPSCPDLDPPLMDSCQNPLNCNLIWPLYLTNGLPDTWEWRKKLEVEAISQIQSEAHSRRPTTQFLP